MNINAAEPTIIQLPSGEAFYRYADSAHYETPEEAARRLSRAFLVQRIGNVVRVVRTLKDTSKARS